ncbi:type II secretion system protein M [Denitratisoma oestradiolicum]|uniref:MSHA biogenesis protein MshJ n=1 Tax=Denitratisoma oestradiolicum TaxID=311182 RepID=A0A6S6XP25_9PROT|nr:type II secretion system protein M [Denitratisoma oestradiolicum]TWO80536.1 hypothetical protein CBW56_08840 [Denitratisoma oestradiolicum]CAB1367606.1 conserved protein of unknown function [Denitratisoma oestradiolicum]
MKARWNALAARFAALGLRERRMTAGAVVLVTGLGGYMLGLEPSLLKMSALEKQLIRQRGELAVLEPQVAEMKARLRDPDAANRAALAEAHSKLAALDVRLREYDSILVPPDQVPRLLQALLARHRGLELVSLRTLAPAPLIAPPAGETVSASKGEVATGNLFRHGIELRMAGPYPDLQRYLSELEGSPQKLLWEHMSLVAAYPRSELTLRLYTLSLDSTWLVV